MRLCQPVWRSALSQGRCLLFFACVVILGACGGRDGPGAGTPEAGPIEATETARAIPPTRQPPTPGPFFPGAGGFFPITVAVEHDKAWLTVDSVTRDQVAEGQSEATLVLKGSVLALSDGIFDYRLLFIDSEGKAYEDSPGVLLGTLQAGDDVTFETSIRVPLEATLVKLAFRIVGTEEPQLSYLIDLPVADIPSRSF